MRRFILSAAVCISACGGGGGGSSTPTTPTPAPSTPAPSPSWTLAGDVMATLSGTPVSGATVTAGDLNATTDAAGRFELRQATAPSSPLAVRVDAAGFLSRETRITHPRTTTLRLDLIRDAAPFDLTLYRALVRDSTESPELRPNYRWTQAPTFYLKTMDDVGRQVEPEVLDVVRRELADSWSAWTDGRYAARLEEGVTDRDAANGQVRVLFIRKPEGRICGQATVGGNRGWIKFYLDGCDCGSLKVDPAVIWHEVGHTAGFFHTRGSHLMSPFISELCNRRAEVTSAELYHARIAYERPRGNLDLDKDPASFAFTRPSSGAPRGPVVCFR